MCIIMIKSAYEPNDLLLIFILQYIIYETFLHEYIFINSTHAMH